MQGSCKVNQIGITRGTPSAPTSRLFCVSRAVDIHAFRIKLLLLTWLRETPYFRGLSQVARRVEIDPATDANPTICLLVVDSGGCRQMSALCDNNARAGGR
jgi:hypothetical protein